MKNKEFFDRKKNWHLNQEFKGFTQDIQHLRNSIEEFCFEANIAKNKQDVLSSEIETAERLQGAYAYAGERQQLMYLFYVIIFPIVYLTNLILIRRPTEYLVSLLVDNNLIAFLLTLVIPLLLLGLEIYISAQRYHVLWRQKSSNPMESGGKHLFSESISAELRVWRTLSWVMIAITPCLYLASTWLKFIQEQVFNFSSLSLAVCLGTLALISDFAVVCGYNNSFESLVFFLFQSKQHYRYWRLRQLEAVYRKNILAAKRCFNQYKHKLYWHNQQYADMPLEPMPFSKVTHQLLGDYINHSAH